MGSSSSNYFSLFAKRFEFANFLIFLKMELQNPPLSSTYDWLLYDRLAYTRLSYETNPPWSPALINQNTFCNASLNVTRARRANEFTSVRQRNAYYDFMSYVF